MISADKEANMKAAYRKHDISDKIWRLLEPQLEAQSEAMSSGDIAVDESDFGRRRKGKRGRGAAGKL